MLFSRPSLVSSFSCLKCSFWRVSQPIERLTEVGKERNPILHCLSHDYGDTLEKCNNNSWVSCIRYTSPRKEGKCVIVVVVVDGAEKIDKAVYC